MFLQSFQQKISWLTPERRAWVSAVVAGCLIGFGTGNGHTTQSAVLSISDRLGQTQKALVIVKTKDEPALQTQIKQAACDNQKLAAVAAQGIAANESDAVKAPNWQDLAGCPTVAPVKAPPISKILPK